ncbi:hypothetical protein KF728_22180 [Candidatus Obscuribacterales bacterium]|nr:hypothetical protein [Candidatus Obscuribacterales bacterium]MBX3152884.1 hypothetical protein [Candidatus Obscuribacterales bacterium]
MRNWIITTIIVLLMSTAFSGNINDPQPVKVGVQAVTCESATATNPPDALSGDFYFVDGYRDFKGPIRVIDSNKTDRVDFPQMGRFK